ncbi:acetate/propionate family kinase [Rudaea cellulosilytica]|uniref:acetate/propionate family kinase n=1 Tax=Rudaea cellulosilytica TaxID=540746 RepID=UPI000367DB75|nr:acetate/propionate family kinase [Rudaea cellulosilytica]
MSGSILVLNCGSSSIKFALFDAIEPPPRQASWKGKVEGIDSDAPTFTASDCAAQAIRLDPTQPYHAALARIRERAQLRLGNTRLAAVAHRVVHGGSKYFAPVRVDANVLADLKGYIPLAPLHQPFALEAIDELLRSHPGLPQIACFDTAFHATLPDVEKLLPLPYDAWQRGLRRYGFHGLSYEYLSIALAERYGERARGRTICAHLGSGASLCGMRNLQSAATTMGFSALDGLMMGTRCGALDPGALLYLMEIEKLGVSEVADLLYHRSGLLGVSGISSDPRALLPEENANERARLALALYVRRIVREIGALIAVLGGLDMLVFTAGIGEHNAVLRERICDGLEWFGVELDRDRNAINAATVSGAGSRVLVAVEPTNEEWIAAKHCVGMLDRDEVAIS